MDPMNGTTPNGVETLSTGIGSSGTGAPEQNAQAAPSVGSSIPEGWTVGAQPQQQQQPQQGNQPPTSIPEGWTVGEQPQVPGSHEMQVGDDDGLLMGGAKAIGGTLEGIGEGVFGTVAGASDIGDKVLGIKPGAVNKYLHNLAGDNVQEHGTFQKVGYGGETLMELLLGDEVLKALPLAKRLGIVSKTMQTLEQSPRLMALLKAGAELGDKSKLLSSPIVQEALKQAATQGAMQGAQSFVKTGGDFKEAGEQALIGGAGAGVTSAALGGVGKLVAKPLSRLAATADTADKFSGIASNAPTKENVYNTLADHLKDAKKSVDDIFEDAKTSAATDRDATVAQSANKRMNSKGTMEDMAREHESQVESDHADRMQKIETGKKEAQNFATSELVSGLKGVAGDQPIDTEKLAVNVRDALNDFHKEHHLDFEDAINGDEGVVTASDGVELDHMETPIQEEAAKILKKPIPGEHEAVTDAKELSGNKLPSDLTAKLEKWATGEAPAAEKGQPGTPLKPWTVKSTIDFRQEMRAARAGTMPGSAEYNAYGRIIKAADDTVEKLVNEAGSPELAEKYTAAKAKYATEQRLLDTDLAEKLRLNDPDKALNDVNHYILTGVNSLGKIDALGKMVGEGGMQSLARSQAGAWAKMAAKEPETFLAEFDKIAPEVREKFFGPKLTDQLQQLADKYTGTLDYAGKQADQLLDAATSDKKEFTALGKKLYGSSIGPGDNDISGTVGRSIKSDFAAESKAADAKYKDAVAAAKDAYDEKAGNLNRAFLSNLENARGEAIDALQKGNVDAVDIRNLKKAIGDDKWSDIAHGLFQRAIADASPGERFDPEKLVKWWTEIDEPVRREMFDVSKPEIASQISDMMTEAEKAAPVKRMVKWFGAYPAVGGATMAAASVLGGAHGPIAELLAGAAGAGGASKLKVGQQLIEWIANHPKVWNTLRGASNVARSPIMQDVKKIAPKLPGTIRGTYEGLKGSLSQ